LPSTDSESPIHKDNLPKTCGKCHLSVVSGKEIGPVHARVDKTVIMVKKIVRIVYTFLILFTIGGMIIYCFLDYLKKQESFIKRE